MEYSVLSVRSALSIILAGSLLSLTACGGGGSSSSSGNTKTPIKTKKTSASQPSITKKTVSVATKPTKVDPKLIGVATLTQKQLLARINKIRSQGRFCYSNGKTWYPAAPAVKWSKELEQSSKKFAEDMAKHDYYNYFGSNAHIQPDTSKPKVNGKYTGTITLQDRVLNAQYLVQRKIGGSAGENLAWSINRDNTDVNTALNTAYKDWLSSRHQHCETIMRANWKDFAMSGAYNKDTHKYYFVQTFGERSK